MTSLPAIATFKELCVDTHPVGGVATTALSAFWAAATGCEQRFFGTPGDSADAGDVVGTEEGQGIAVCPVPEPRTVKHRVHLDVHTADVADLVAHGARIVREPDDEIHWYVLEDPEGGELCAFVREPHAVPAYRTYEMVVDSADAVSIGRWWADVFGVPVQRRGEEPWCWLEDVPGMSFEAWVFSDVPEPKTVKNRWHWDVYGEVEDFLARGATLLWEMPRWTVLGDPEGNEFCVFPRPS
jgi:hypothetical protein